MSIEFFLKWFYFEALLKFSHGNEFIFLKGLYLENSFANTVFKRGNSLPIRRFFRYYYKQIKNLNLFKNYPKPAWFFYRRSTWSRFFPNLLLYSFREKIQKCHWFLSSPSCRGTLDKQTGSHNFLSLIFLSK